MPSEHHPKWAKLTGEQVEIMGFSTYTGEAILIDYALNPIDDRDSFYFNAQEFFSDEELKQMPFFGTELFRDGEVGDTQ